MSDDFLTLMDEHRKKEDAMKWEGTFSDYFQLVLHNPAIARGAHQRIYDMIAQAGIHYDEESEREHYRFFEDHLFGIDGALAQVMEYFKAAAFGSDVRRRILLLFGPPSSGKSALVIALKRGLEAYSRTEEGALYAIADCPQHEEPLHLVPDAYRPGILAQHGIMIEGQLCPRCAVNLVDLYDNDITKVPVKRVFLSERDRIGIGTFVPSDPKSQDIAELVGSIDLAQIGEYGAESDPRAYRFDGELNVANRGLMEFIEMLKADEKFLYVLLTLAQERNIKTGRFPLIYADECIVSHTNEAEFREFMDDERSEALRDRMIAVRIPYNLNVRDEVRIYKKLIAESRLQHVHIAPHTLQIVSIFSVLTRLEASPLPGLTRLKKLKLYDGEDVEGFTQRDVKKIKNEAVREGMDGISPRFIINRLSTSMIKPEVTCINPIDALRAVKEGIEQLPSMTAKEKEEALGFISEARKEYDERARVDVQKAFFVSFDEEVETLLSNYLDHVEAYLDGAMLLDPITGEECEPDERLMRSIEEKIRITEGAKDSFRNEIFRKVAMAERRHERFDYATHDKLKEALERQLFEERRDTIKLTVSARNPDEEQLRRINQVVATLTDREGYCVDCANELLKYVASLMAREK